MYEHYNLQLTSCIYEWVRISHDSITTYATLCTNACILYELSLHLATFYSIYSKNSTMPGLIILAIKRRKALR